MKTYNKAWEYIKSGLYLILCFLISIPIVTFCGYLYRTVGVIMAVLIGFCSVGATVCIYADSAIKLGKKYRNIDERSKNNLANRNFGVNFGIVPTAISYSEVILVFLSKFSIVNYDFYPLYKTLNMYFLPWTYIFSPNSYVMEGERLLQIPVPATELSAAALVFISVLPLIFIATTAIAYKIGYNNIDLKEKILYGK